MRRAFVTPSSEDGQDIAEYAVMVAVILPTILGTIRLIGSNAMHTTNMPATAVP